MSHSLTPSHQFTKRVLVDIVIVKRVPVDTVTVSVLNLCLDRTKTSDTTASRPVLLGLEGTSRVVLTETTVTETTHVKRQNGHVWGPVRVQWGSSGVTRIRRSV